MSHRVTLLTIGSLKTPWATEVCSDYVKRLGHSLHFDVVELPASKAREPERQRCEESARIVTALKKRDREVWVFDERGERLSSQAFAQSFQSLQDSGVPLTLVIGGAYGLDDSVRTYSKRTIRLSDLTYPHELARVVLLEQLYRAQQIVSGTEYHH